MIRFLLLLNAIFVCILGGYALEANTNHTFIYTSMIFYCAWFPAIYGFIINPIE